MDCEFCKKKFSTLGNLVAHQKKTKYCLKIQEENKPREYICGGCEKKLSNNHRLQQHQKICEKHIEINKIRQLESVIEQNKILIDLKNEALEKSEKHIEKLENHIQSLEDKLLKIAMRTTKTTNIITNIQQNFTPITDEKLAEDSKKLTLQHLAGGGEKIADIFLDGSLKNNAICTDVSRKILHLKDGDGKLVKDVNANIITKRAFSSMLGIARDIKNKYGEGIDANDDAQIEMFGKVMCVFGEISQAISGQSNDVSSDFAKAVCVGSIVGEK
jgi:hypothetical protein